MGRFFNDPAALRADTDAAADVAQSALEQDPPKQDGQVRARHLVELAAMLRSWCTGYANFIGRRTLQLHDDLSARVTALEKQPFAYDGTYEQDKVYDKGTFVTHDGSMWHANRKTAQKPGDGQAWTLAVKRGRDAR